MAKIGGVQEVRTELLVPYENNAKIHSKSQVNQIAESIKEFGFISPCLIDKNFNIIRGHGRVMARKQLGMETVPCLFVEGLTETQRRAYILADNRLTELGEWDFDKVQIELKELEDLDFNIELTGFEDMSEYNPVSFEIQDDEYTDEVEERASVGQIWKLGKHRLMVGDSTCKEDVERLMEGQKADLLVTDPPYNVEYVGKSKDELIIQNDRQSNQQFEEFLFKAFSNAYEVMKDGASYYCWYAFSSTQQFYSAISRAKLSLKQELIWNKNSLVLSRQDYQWKHEPCVYGWKETSSHNFYGDRKQTTVIDWDRPTQNTLHPTMKPVGLFSYLIENSSKESDVVLDLFGGSGTTLIACEHLNRRCHMMEIDPHYASVIINRWEELTHEKAEVLK